MKTDNIYHRARMQAAQRNPLHASRERTANEIYVSCEALADYENGRTVPRATWCRRWWRRTTTPT